MKAIDQYDRWSFLQTIHPLCHIMAHISSSNKTRAYTKQYDMQGGLCCFHNHTYIHVYGYIYSVYEYIYGVYKYIYGVYGYIYMVFMDII